MDELERFRKVIYGDGRNRTAYKLLFSVYAQVGPYNENRLEDDTARTIAEFFGFDDSE